MTSPTTQAAKLTAIISGRSSTRPKVRFRATAIRKGYPGMCQPPARPTKSWLHLAYPTTSLTNGEKPVNHHPKHRDDSASSPRAKVLNNAPNLVGVAIKQYAVGISCVSTDTLLPLRTVIRQGTVRSFAGSGEGMGLADYFLINGSYIGR